MKWKFFEMTIRRLASVSLLLVINLIAGVFYLQTKRPMTYSDDVNNDTIFWNTTSGNRTHSITANITQNTSQNKTEIEITEANHQMTFPHDYNYIIENTDLCLRGTSKDKKHSLVILVCTAVNNFESRKAIRETWGSLAYSNNNTGSIRLGFLLGATKNRTLQQLVLNESIHHSDLIQEDFEDTYQNLTLKSVMLLKWVTKHCENVHFVLKTDDDMYINVQRLVQVLRRLPLKRKVMYGTLFKKARPNRNKSAKWYVPKEQFKSNVFPDYLSGTAYVMSRDIIPVIYEISTTLPFLVMEDVFITGLCASQAGVQRYNVKGFVQWKRNPTGCAFRDAISGHHVTIKDMKKIWTELQKPKLICRTTRRTAKG